MKYTKFWIRVCSLFGILGGVLLFSGDMLLYYDNESSDIVTNMSKMSNFRIILSALFALFSSWFYLLGVIPVYYAFKPTNTKIKNITALSLSFILVGYGVIHGAYIAIATSAKIANNYHLNMDKAIALASQANDAMRLFIYPLFALLSWLFITQVWKKNTLYPRWMVFFFPLSFFLLQYVLSPLLSGRLWLIILGGYYNLIIVVFFTASTFALWNTVGKT